MRPTSLLRTALITPIAAMLIASGSPLAQQDPAMHPDLGPVTPPGSDWTVVTMAPNGSLGVATAASAGQAIAQAIRNCRAMSREGIGCGAQSKAVRAAWVVAVRCGATNIITADALLSDAERAADDREAELRRIYTPNLPPCRRVLTVDPQGGIGLPGS